MKARTYITYIHNGQEITVRSNLKSAATMVAKIGTNHEIVKVTTR